MPRYIMLDDGGGGSSEESDDSDDFTDSDHQFGGDKGDQSTQDKPGAASEKPSVEVSVKLGVFLPGAKVNAKSGEIVNEIGLSDLEVISDVIELLKKGKDALKIAIYPDAGFESDAKGKQAAFVEVGVGFSVFGNIHAKVKVPFDDPSDRSYSVGFEIGSVETEVDVVEQFHRTSEVIRQSSEQFFQKLYYDLGAPSLLPGEGQR